MSHKKVMSTEGKEFIVQARKQILRFECCDCSLTHDFEFDIKNKKEIGVTIKRNNYSTGQKRKNNCVP